MRQRRKLIRRVVNAVLLSAMLIPMTTPARAQADAASIYKAKCTLCHGPDGKGDTPIGKANKIRDLASPEVQKQSDSDLAAIITAGKNKMPAYGKTLAPEQVQSLVNYIRSFAKKS